MKPRILLVDGHSMIFGWPQLAADHSRNTAAARARLVRILNALQDATDWTIAVVFDGRGPQATEATEPGGISVFYSKSGQTADALIERLTAKYASQYAVTVATEDHMERTTVASLGGTSIGARELLAEIEGATRDLSDRLGRLHRAARLSS